LRGAVFPLEGFGIRDAPGRGENGERGEGADVRVDKVLEFAGKANEAALGEIGMLERQQDLDDARMISTERNDRVNEEAGLRASLPCDRF
jgi:hypothetical protein